ncbi:amidase signature enzyme [Bimuria novae-zelandiae CBS 107.79]|uniref:Amidase signature enzyme n=1 Tax=Bimuria novae-zelandiae CBS 107.79 TaxID=1447943 RepID=A0A6A5UK58_9PLEO|nr:amidase signature enzyme [Bimuria novae-zelandiae CBS 107.79]
MSLNNLTIPSLLDTSLFELCYGLDQGLFTSVDLIRAYLQRIREVDSNYHAVIEVNPDALDIAKQMDVERVRSSHGRPLLGTPILVKDSIVTLDSMEATAGSMALVGAKPSKESAVVTALRHVGAIILGKTNMAEWAGFRSTSGCSGWSARGGQAYGPFCPNMKTSGSSTGSAIATALGLASAAIGTETCYSIVHPAERCGVVGFTPTRGLLSSEGIIYASAKEDTVGVITKTVNDASGLVSLLADNEDARGNLYVPLAMRTDLCGVRIGIPARGLLPEVDNMHSAKQTAFSKLINHLTTCGANIVSVDKISGVATYAELPARVKGCVLNTDMKTSINNYLSSLITNPNKIHTLDDLIAFTKLCPEEGYPARNVARLEAANATDPSDPLYRYLSSLEDATYATTIPGTLRDFDLHVLLVPNLSATLQTFAAKAGSPVMSVSMGRYPEDTEIEIDARSNLVDVAPGIPFSVYIFGDRNRDGNVIRVGHACERIMNARSGLKPYVLPTTDLAGHTESPHGL